MAPGSGPEEARSRGPEDVLAVLTAVERSLASVPRPSPVRGSRAGWAEVVRSSQRIVEAATATQDAAIAQLAAIEPEELEDGTEVESHRAPGHVSLDAPAVLAGVLNVSATHAQRRVDRAVWLAADGPVVAALAPHFTKEDAVRLRRRCRRTLARISPDLLRQRAQRARSASGLRRWAEEPGVDRWEGTFPSAEAATAWAAIDVLAHDYVARGECVTIDRARAKALTDLVTGHSTVRTVVTLTVPADAGSWAAGQQRPPSGPVDVAVGPSSKPSAGGGRASQRSAAGRDGSGEKAAAPDPAATHPDDLVEAGGLRPGDAALVSRSWIDRRRGRMRPGRPARTVPPPHRVPRRLLRLPAEPEPCGADPTP